MAELVRSARAAAVCSLLLFAGCKEPPPRATSTSAPPVSPAKPYRELAARQNKPRALTAAGASLFWINEGGLEKYQPGVAPAGLMRVAIAGGAVERIADVAPDAALAADGDTLYFTDRKAGALYALAQTGGAPHTLARGLAEPSALAVDEAAVYVLTGSSVALANEKPASLDGGKLTPARAELTDARDGAVWRVPKRGGKAAAIVTQLPLASGLELDGERLYIRTFFGGRLLAAAKAGGATRVVVEEPRQWATWLADRGGVFWSTMDLDPVVRGLINGRVETLARPSQLPWRLAADATHLFFADAEGLRRVPRSGGAVQTVAKFSMQVSELILAGDTLYFCDVLSVDALPR